MAHRAGRALGRVCAPHARDSLGARLTRGPAVPAAPRGKVLRKFPALPVMPISCVLREFNYPCTSSSEDSAPCSRGAPGLDSFLAGVQPERFPVLCKGETLRGGAFKAPFLMHACFALGGVFPWNTVNFSIGICENKGAKTRGKLEHQRGICCLWKLCFVFPEMNFPSNQLDGGDNFLLGEVRLWPGEGSVGWGRGWGAVTRLLRAAVPAVLGANPLSPAVVPGPCHPPALLLPAPEVLEALSWGHLSLPGQAVGCPRWEGHGQGEILVEELSRYKVQRWSNPNPKDTPVWGEGLL